MFVNLMRVNQRWLMIVISVPVIISFLWYLNNSTHVDRAVSDKVGSLYGRTLTGTERDRVVRQIQTAGGLGLRNVMDRDILGRGDEIDAVVNHLVVEHQAEEMGIYPTDDEVAAAVQALPAFQAPGGQFDPKKYAEFVGDNLAPRGFTERQLEEIVRRDIQFGKVRAIVDAPVVVSPVEVRVAFEERNAKTNASVIRLASADFAAGITEPTEDEIKKAYEEQKVQYVQPEKRKVQYVAYLLTDDQKKLSQTEKNAALKTLGDQANNLLVDLIDNKGRLDFAGAAAKANLPVKETGEFEQAQTDGLPEANIPGFAGAAFRLTKDEPDSDVPLQTPDGFYDLHLAGSTPVRPQTFEEARDKVVKALKEERIKAAMNTKAEEIRNKVAEALKAGKSFDDAAKEAGQTVQQVPAFSMMEPAQTAPDAAVIAETAQDLAVGELSKFVSSSSGGMLVYVRSREGTNEAKFNEQQGLFAARMERLKNSVYFGEWLRASRDAARVSIIPRNDRG